MCLKNVAKVKVNPVPANLEESVKLAASFLTRDMVSEFRSFMVTTPYILILVDRLKKEYPSAEIALQFSTPFQLLAATILSAQCTDERVNIVTQTLFNKYKTLKDFAMANPSDFEKDIYSTGFYKNKTKSIIGSAKIILAKFNGKIPSKMDDLLTLPGVARKTANIVLSNVYEVIAGIAVDTHVIRLSHRLGLSKNKRPEKIEIDLMKIVPKSAWKKFSYLIQSHGRKTCQAKKPNCEICILNDICPKIGVVL